MADLSELHEVEVRFYNERDFPVAIGRIPKAQLGEFDRVLAEVRERYPQMTHEGLARYVWAYGMRGLTKAVARGILPDPSRTPMPMTG